MMKTNFVKYPLSPLEARMFGLVAFLFVAGDYLTTLFAVNLFGADEGNVLLSPIINTPYLFPLLAAKLTLILLIYAVEVRSPSKHRVRSYTVTAGLWLGVVLNNVLVIMTQAGILTSAAAIMMVLYLILAALLWASWAPNIVSVIRR